jgi:thioredoxin-like negative regulator of GroEL
VADALVDLERAHVRFPDDVEIALALAQAYEARGTASMRPALVAPPDSDAGRDLRTAAALFTDVLRQHPALGRARVRLGRLTSLLGEEDAALTELARAATQGDERVAYLSHLFAGEILRRRSRRLDARAEFEKARDALPRGQAAALGLAETLHALGDFERAAQALFPGIEEPVPADPARMYWAGDPEEDKARLEALKRSIVR